MNIWQWYGTIFYLVGTELMYELIHSLLDIAVLTVLFVGYGIVLCVLVARSEKHKKKRKRGVTSQQ